MKLALGLDFTFGHISFSMQGFGWSSPGRARSRINIGVNRLEVYEQDPAFSQYMALHYAPAGLQMPFAGGPTEATEFPVRCAMRAVELARRLGILQTAGSPGAAGRALDVGCAVGRSAFELARAFGSVVAIDRSERFIQAAGELKERGRLRYVLPEEGDIIVEEEGVVPRRHRSHPRHIPGRRRLRPPRAGPVRSSIRRQPPLPFTAPAPLPRSPGEPIRPSPPRRITIHHNPLHLDGNLHPQARVARRSRKK